LRKFGSANLSQYNKDKRLKVAIHDFSSDITTTYPSIDEASKTIKLDSKAFWSKEKYVGSALLKSNDVIPYQGRYVITILREGIINTDHVKRVELARANISKGLSNWNKAKGNVVVVTNVITNDQYTYNSLSEAARALNVNRFTISRRIKDKKILNGLYKFSYL
jgi:putative methionine-R-sulfoxide reductase with GAF domain